MPTVQKLENICQRKLKRLTLVSYPRASVMTAADMPRSGAANAEIPLHIKAQEPYELPFPGGGRGPRPSGRKVSDADVELHRHVNERYTGPKKLNRYSWGHARELADFLLPRRYKG